MKLKDWKDSMNTFGANGTPFFCMVDFEMEHPLILPLADINTNELLFDLNGTDNLGELCQTPNGYVSFKKSPILFSQFCKSFDIVQKHLVYGNSFLTNLTFPTAIETNLSLKDIFFASKQPYKVWYKDEFVVFSPEKFIQIYDNSIHSFPMKGTIDASIPNAKEIILQDKKEAAEHATIVDLIRNDLSILATDVSVNQYRYIDRISTNQKDLLQVSSHISGKLNTDWKTQLGDIVLSLLPAGSISGAPKDKTLEIIREAELDKRGYYTGIVGIFDGQKFDSAVMIRFVESQNGQLVFRSGGGITAQSKAQDEYNEMVDKVYFPFKK